MKQKYPEIEHQFDVWHLSKKYYEEIAEESTLKG